jgi:hypothetical protein
LIAHSEIHVVDETIHAGNGKSNCLGGKLRGAYFFKDAPALHLLRLPHFPRVGRHNDRKKVS